MPTFAALAGYQGSAELRWDGRDIRPILEGVKPTEPRTLYGAGPGFRGSFVRAGDWKLIVSLNGKQPDELFNLSRDPYEKENVASREPERVAELKAILARQAVADNDRTVPKNPEPE
jgi:arylsulfatase A-like enzyme